MKCQSCGRTSKEKYCSQCTDENGNLKSFNEIAQNLTDYFIETQGFDPEVAKSAAIGVMSRQPAWEQKVKKEQAISNNNKMKLTIIITAFVVAVTSGSLVYWFTATKTVKSKVTYENISTKSSSPFDEIEEREADGLQVFEMKCQGDQKIVHLDDKTLVFKSLEGGKNSKQYNMYCVDLENMQGVPFVPESMATREMLLPTNFRIFNRSDDSEPKLWLFDPVKGETKPLLDRIIGYNHLYYIYENTGDPSKYAYNLGTGKKIRIPDSSIYSIFNNRFEPDYYFYNDENLFFPNYNAYKMLNLVTGETTGLSVDTSINVLGGTDNYKVMRPMHEPEDHSLYVMNLRAEQLIKIDDEFTNVPVLTDSKNQGNVFIYYQKEDKKTKQISTYYKNIFKPEQSPQEITKDDAIIYPIHATKTCLVYTTKKNAAFGKWNGRPDNEIALTDLWVRDLASGKDYQLEAGGVDKIEASENFLVWTKWQGSKQDQFFNICVARMLPQKINSDAYLSDNLPYNNLKKTSYENLEVTEMVCEGDQTFDKGKVDYSEANIDEYGRFIDNRLRFNPPSREVMEIKQYTPDENSPTTYLFDPQSKEGVILTKDDYKTKDFLDNHKLSFKWDEPDYYLEKNMCMYDYANGNFSMVGNSIVPKSLSIRKEKRGNDKTAIIFNDLKQDHELMVLENKTDDFSLSLERNLSGVVFSIEKLQDHDSHFYYLDTKNATTLSLGKNIKVLDSNDRYVLIRPDIMEMPRMKLFDMQTKEIQIIEPNLHPLVGDLGNCKLNEATNPDDLMLAWPYPETDNYKVNYNIAYSKLSDIRKKTKKTNLSNKSIDMDLVGLCGEWVLYKVQNKTSVVPNSSSLFGLNTASGKSYLIDENFSGLGTRINGAICWISNKGYHNRQFNNICFAKLR